MSGDADLYVLARRVLLDALEALGPHRNAVVLVGAQAVYLRVGDADLAVAPYTTDGDLVIDPPRLAEVPPLEQGLERAGFHALGGDKVGVWAAARGQSGAEITIDLLVPATLAPGAGRRAARLRGHDAKAARVTAGLEGTVVDADMIEVAALDPADTRSFPIRVAGPAALVTAKVYKIEDRSGSDRLQDKDALDVFRLIRGTSTEDMSDRFRALLADTRRRGLWHRCPPQRKAARRAQGLAAARGHSQAGCHPLPPEGGGGC